VRRPWSVATPTYFLPRALNLASREQFSPFLGLNGAALGEVVLDVELTSTGMTTLGVATTVESVVGFGAADDTAAADVPGAGAGSEPGMH
jgi:hypothetical protein